MTRSQLVVPFVGLLFTLAFGLMPMLRKEGLSRRFLVESLCLTAAGTLAVFCGVPLHPIAFLVAIYLVTMRVRILADVASGMARRGKMKSARRLYGLAHKLSPDPVGTMILELNEGACCLKEGDFETAVRTLRGIIEKAPASGLGVKHLCACHFNLGVAYWRMKMTPEASASFEAVMDIWPASLMARRAENALEKLRQSTETAKQDDASRDPAAERDPDESRVAHGS
jgi:tetratricopeptide (TPR) repeat protein